MQSYSEGGVWYHNYCHQHYTALCPSVADVDVHIAELVQSLGKDCISCSFYNRFAVKMLSGVPAYLRVEREAIV